MTPRRLNALLSALVAALGLAALFLGPASLAPGEVVAGLLWGEGPAGLVVREIRLPRALLAIAIGALLGLSGAALQGLLRNPLAAPSLFGAPQAAALGAVLVLYFGLVDALSWALPVAAILGAFLSVGLLVLVAGRSASLLVLILAGLAISSLAGALTSLAINLAPNPFAVTEIVFWLLGSLEDRTMRHLAILAPFGIVSAAVLFAHGTAFRAMTLGEEVAQSLGVAVEPTRLLVVVGVATGVGASVAIAGAIGFVGLVAPHLVRPLVGHDPKKVLVPAALAGAALLSAADLLVRLIPSNGEIKVGVVTALVGVPFFLWIVFRRRRELSGSVA